MGLGVVVAVYCCRGGGRRARWRAGNVSWWWCRCGLEARGEMEDPAARLTNSGGAAQPSDSSPLAVKESRPHISGRFLSLSICLLDWMIYLGNFRLG